MSKNTITFRRGPHPWCHRDGVKKTACEETEKARVSSDGIWGLRWRDMRGWQVTHIPTGFSAGPDFPRLHQAIRYCKTLAEQPDLWNTGYKFGVMPEWAGKPHSPQCEAADAARRKVLS